MLCCAVRCCAVCAVLSGQCCAVLGVLRCACSACYAVYTVLCCAPAKGGQALRALRVLPPSIFVSVLDRHHLPPINFLLCSCCKAQLLPAKQGWSSLLQRARGGLGGTAGTGPQPHFSTTLTTQNLRETRLMRIKMSQGLRPCVRMKRAWNEDQGCVKSAGTVSTTTWLVFDKTEGTDLVQY